MRFKCYVIVIFNELNGTLKYIWYKNNLSSSKVGLNKNVKKIVLFKKQKKKNKNKVQFLPIYMRSFSLFTSGHI